RPDVDARPVTDARPVFDAPPPDASCAGGCPTGYHCGTANNLAVCRNDTSSIPLFSHVFVIMMENLSVSELDETDNVGQSPFLHSLRQSGAYGSDYHGVAHPSLPNYLALTSGDFYRVRCDCTPMGDGDCGIFSCTLITHDCSCPQDAQHIG